MQSRLGKWSKLWNRDIDRRDSIEWAMRDTLHKAHQDDLGGELQLDDLKKGLTKFKKGTFEAKYEMRKAGSSVELLVGCAVCRTSQPKWI